MGLFLATRFGVAFAFLILYWIGELSANSAQTVLIIFLLLTLGVDLWREARWKQVSTGIPYALLDLLAFGSAWVAVPHPWIALLVFSIARGAGMTGRNASQSRSSPATVSI